MTTLSERTTPATGTSDKSSGSENSWSVFVEGGNEHQFYPAWLALLCERLGNVSVGVLLLRANASDSFAPVALWPSVPRDLAFLSGIAEQALTERRGVLMRAKGDAADNTWRLAYPLSDEQEVVGAVVIEASRQSEHEAKALLRELHWGLGWLQEVLTRHRLLAANGKLNRLGSVMEIVAASLREVPSHETLLELANRIARDLECTRAVIGLVDHGHVRVASISDAAWFEANASITKHYLRAMEEVVDRLSPVVYEKSGSPAPAARDSTAHAELAEASGAKFILSAPLTLGANCIAVVTVERNDSRPFTAEETQWMEALTALLPSAIDQKRRAERGFLARLNDDTRKLLSRLFGKGYLLWKTIATVLCLTIALLALVEVDYRVTAKTVIEGETQRAIAAPFQGFIAASFVRAGDVVKAGQPLCKLDDRELKLERNKWSSEREQHLRELREAMANHELTQIQVISAQVQQSEAQLELTEDRIARAEIVAPIDGLVISGDLSQLIGSPVEQGKELFELAPLTNYRVILQVDESEIQHIVEGQSGDLIVSGMASTLPLTVSRLTPVATAEEGKNFFRVEAELLHAPGNLRPGMEGVGKIRVGDRRLWWVLTHTFTDWLRVWLWRWMP